MAELSDALKNLHNTLVDSRNGYDEARKQTTQPGMAELFRNMIVLRTKHIGEIEHRLATMGVDFDVSGTLMSTVHRTVIDIRSLLTGLDANALPSFASGEENILKQYDQTLRMAGGDNDVTTLLTQQRDVVAAKIDGMRRQAPAA